MNPQFSEDASARMAKARAAAERRYYRRKGNLGSMLKSKAGATRTELAAAWEEDVRDLCAYYTRDILVAEAREFEGTSHPLHEVQAFLDRRVEELSRKVMHSPKWPAEGHLDKRMHRLIGEVNLRRQIDFIKSSPQWKRWQSRIFGTRRSVPVTALTPQAEALTRAAESSFPQANQAGATEPSGDESVRAQVGPAVYGASKAGADRRKAVDAYIEEVFNRTQKRITRTDIWKSARYKTRTEFERWERNDRRATKAAHQRFTRILSEKPHLK